DGVLDNLRGDQPARLGVTYDDLREANPCIVCAHLSAYGRDGSRANWPGYDYLMQAEAGYLSLTGEPDGAPARFGLSVVDMMAGVYAALALLGGIVRARDGAGQGRRGQPVRYRAVEPDLPGDMVPQRGPRAGPRAALGASVADPQ